MLLDKIDTRWVGIDQQEKLCLPTSNASWYTPRVSPITAVTKAYYDVTMLQMDYAHNNSSIFILFYFCFLYPFLGSSRQVYLPAKTTRFLSMTEIRFNLLQLPVSGITLGCISPNFPFSLAFFGIQKMNYSFNFVQIIFQV